jgi:LacI family transcriptional regulator
MSLKAVRFGGDTIEQGREVALELLGGERDFTAVVAFNDLAATGVIRAARTLGIEVPRQLSIVGFDDIRLASLVDPALTTVRAPMHEMGARATQLLFEHMEGDPELRWELLRGDLVVRDSTAPPP